MKKVSVSSLLAAVRDRSLSRSPGRDSSASGTATSLGMVFPRHARTPSRSADVASGHLALPQRSASCTRTRRTRSTGCRPATRCSPGYTDADQPVLHRRRRRQRQDVERLLHRDAVLRRRRATSSTARRSAARTPTRARCRRAAARRQRHVRLPHRRADPGRDPAGHRTRRAGPTSPSTQFFLFTAKDIGSCFGSSAARSRLLRVPRLDRQRLERDPLREPCRTPTPCRPRCDAGSIRTATTPTRRSTSRATSTTRRSPIRTATRGTTRRARERRQVRLDLRRRSAARPAPSTTRRSTGTTTSSSRSTRTTTGPASRPGSEARDGARRRA